MILGPLNILHLLSYHLYTGPVEPVLGLAREQRRAGHDARLAIDTLRDGDIEERALEFGVPVEKRLALSVKSGPILLMRDILALKRFWKGSELDILHAHRSHEHTLAALARPGETKVKLVRTLHTDKASSPGRGWQLRRADGLVAVSNKQRQELIERRILPKDRIIAIDGAVDSSRFCPGPGGDTLRREAGISEDAPLAGIVARMKPGRGHALLLDAWEQVIDRLPAARLLIAGRGELEQSLRDRVAGSKLAGSVVFLGYRNDLPEVYRALDLKLILAPGNDGTCRAALEAMASGVPVLGADTGALPQIISQGRTGRIVSGDDSQLLATALVEMLADRAALKNMGANARTEAQNRFCVEKQADKIEKLYRLALGE